MKKALIIHGGWAGHQPKETSELVAGDLRQNGFKVELSETLDVLFDAAQLHGIDLLIPNWTMGSLSDAQEKGLINAVQSGVGLGGWHGGAGDAFRANTGYQFLVGGQFVAHPDNGKDYIVRITKTSDPVVDGIRDFAVNSEQYYMHVDPSNDVLATTTFETQSTPWVNGTVMPVVWKRRYGQGRVFYHSIGHGPAELQIPEVREITKRGLAWAAR